MVRGTLICLVTWQSRATTWITCSTPPQDNAANITFTNGWHGTYSSKLESDTMKAWGEFQHNHWTWPLWRRFCAGFEERSIRIQWWRYYWEELADQWPKHPNVNDLDFAFLSVPWGATTNCQARFVAGSAGHLGLGETLCDYTASLLWFVWYTFFFIT